MGLLDGKVAIITGAGGGIGREHALLMAKLGAKLVVNDLGGSRDGTGGSDAAASKVVEEIKAAGGEAVPNFDNVATVEGGEKIFKAAIDSFGQADILVNNAGILRDKSFVKMTEDLWDAVIAVHLKGTYCCTMPFFQYAKERGAPARIINTTSTSGLFGNFGQANYGAAKAGIAGLTRVLAIEGKKYGINTNAIAPVAFTRMTADLPVMKTPGLDIETGPQLVPPVVAWLASDEAADVNGKIFMVRGNHIELLYVNRIVIAEKPGADGPWDPQEIGGKIKETVASFEDPWKGF